MSNRIIKRRNARKDSTRRPPADFRAAIDRALAVNDIARAAALAQAALAAGGNDPIFLNLAAWHCEEQGDFAGAHRLLRRALDLAPGDLLIAGAIGAVLRKEGRLSDALAVLDRVVATEPRHAAAWLERGYTLDALRQEAASADSYRRALAIDPALAPALGKLADAAARRGDRDEAIALGQQALAIDPREPAATAALATIEIEARDGAAAQRRLSALLPIVRGDDRTRTLTLLGDALDRQNRVADAFAAYNEAQANFRTVYAEALAPGPGRPSHRAFIERITDQIVATPTPKRDRVSALALGSADTHVFLLGYPRSGTTLVENVLASAPNVVALEERDTMADADIALLTNDGKMADLAALDEIEADRLRAAYWNRVRGYGADVSGRIFVDMNPLAGIKLPIIARLFPDARILVMRRDPRDVLLSCYRINFTPSTAAWAFSDLAEAARHYDALMQLTERARERLPLAFQDVRYDHLVTDFKATVAEMAAFVGLEWTDDFLRFDRTAQQRGVQTASATQVRRGLFDGRGQWRRYADQLAPVLPILAPWVERFGFDA